jgi:hypothetical protein
LALPIIDRLYEAVVRGMSNELEMLLLIELDRKQGSFKIERLFVGLAERCGRVA